MGVSGSISCIIRSAPFYANDRYNPSIFATRGREQFLFEGIIVALWTIGCGFSLFITYFGTRIPFSPLRHVVVILGLAMFVVFSMELWNAYADKTPWYSIRETLPQEVWKWLSGGVRKDSTLLKRLVRLSEVYVREFKDLHSFRKKAKIILTDYVKKLLKKYAGVRFSKNSS